MNVERVGFLLLIVGIAILILGGVDNEFLRNLSIVILIVGALTINYKKIIGAT